MSLDVTLQTDPGAISTDPVIEARRQIEVCNACRYCEGYCSVFPAIARQKVFADGDITQLANLCHNCRGCYYACQYTAPHEFALNLPQALAAARVDSWERFAWPDGLADRFQKSGAALVLALVAGCAALIVMIALIPADGPAFYAYVSHGAMLALFVPAFVLPLAAIAVGLRRYWREIGGAPVRFLAIWAALVSVSTMRNLSGGQGQGCNFEDEDRFSDARRRAHQAVMYGFGLCFAATASGTVLHYGFDRPAPYDLLSWPKVFGLPGGVLMTLGCVALLYLRGRADAHLGAPGRASGEIAFVGLLGFVGLTGLLLYLARDTGAVGPLLAAHLGSVLTFFLLTPYTKMAHGFYRFAALIREAQQRQMPEIEPAGSDD